MRTFMILLFLNFLSCQKSEVGKKQATYDKLIMARLVEVSQIPKYVYTFINESDPQKNCANYYFHGAREHEQLKVQHTKCEKTSDIVGVCLSRSTNVVETILYSDKFTTETARTHCLDSAPAGVRKEFLTEYNPDMTPSL